MHRLRIATYNIHKCRGLDGQTRTDRIASVLEEVGADIIALQEVVKDQTDHLAERIGYFQAFGEVRQYRGSGYGNATLSRWDFKLIRPVDVTVAGREQRAALRTDIRLGQHVLHVFNVHLGTGARERKQQAARLLDADLLRAIDISGPRIVLGDFNEWVHGLVTRSLTAEFHLTDLRLHLKRTRSYPALLPLLHLDHIYLDHHLAVEKAHFHRSRRALIASDHLPLVADLILRE
jgi:endonuclease/exonuclease/phosphatase family metal-dependent hydrolase